MLRGGENSRIVLVKFAFLVLPRRGGAEPDGGVAFWWASTLPWPC